MNFLDLFLHADYIIKGVVLLLCGMSVWSWSIIIDKYLELKRNKQQTQYIQTFYNQTGSLQILDTMHSCALKEILNMNYSQDHMIKMAHKESEDLNKNLGMLEAIALISPFVGLFGTVWGIMHTLTLLGSHTTAQLNMVAPMIGEALFVTAIGFIVAIPASFASNILHQQIEQLHNHWFGIILKVTKN